MIRRRDQLRISLQKLRLRKKRSVFSVITIALGMVVLVTADSLIEGVGNAAATSSIEKGMHPDEIAVSTFDNAVIAQLEAVHEAGMARKKPPAKRFQLLTRAMLAEWRLWPEVEAVDQVTTVYSVSIDELVQTPEHLRAVRGVPDALLRRHANPAALAAAGSNAVPVVLGIGFARMVYNQDTGKVELRTPDAAREWIGRPITLRLGDNYASLSRFATEYMDDHFELRYVSDADHEKNREELRERFADIYDPALHDMTLPLTARVVGFYEGDEALVPVSLARQFDAWRAARDEIAALPSMTRDDVEMPVYSIRGRQVARDDEFTEAMVLVKPGVDIEEVARRLDDLGVTAVTRDRLFRAQIKMFESGLRVARRVAYALAGAMMLLAMGLLWNTISRIVSDSRVDIGLFRALGATKRDVRRLFLTEASLLGLMGTSLGILAGWGLALFTSRLVIKYARVSITSPDEILVIPDTIFTFHPGFAAWLLVAGLFLSMLAGLRPANRAANTDPVKALKRE
jgi:hypothetical protein